MNTSKYIKFVLLLIMAVTTFHLGIITKLIPYDIAWGGRLKTDSKMYTFEIISILVNLFFIKVLLIKGGYLKFHVNKKAINIVLWVFLLVFALNTIGNILADSIFEKSFSLITLVLAISIWNILRKKNNSH